MSKVTKRRVKTFLTSILPYGKTDLSDLPFENGEIEQGSAFARKKISKELQLVVELAVSDFENIDLYVNVSYGSMDPLITLLHQKLGPIEFVLSNDNAEKTKLEIKSAVSNFAGRLLNAVNE